MLHRAGEQPWEQSMAFEPSCSALAKATGVPDPAHIEFVLHSSTVFDGPAIVLECRDRSTIIRRSFLELGWSYGKQEKP